jgi:hypothetical protein
LTNGRSLVATRSKRSKFIQDIPDIVSQGGAPQAPAMRAGGHALIVRRRDNGNSVHF